MVDVYCGLILKDSNYTYFRTKTNVNRVRLVTPDVNKKWHHWGQRLSGQK
jgi:hypothetical protein